ncbi:MAG: hypothetical protein AAF438_17315, partial [Pseudomonadota bacterium]
MSIKEAFPLLARNEGVWEGYYRYYNIDGEKIDEHKSRLLCRIPEPDTYHQTNLYRWADGKKDTRDFPSKVEGKKLVFYTDIEGWAAAVDLDEHNRTMMLSWVRKNEPGLYLYEMIQVNDDYYVCIASYWYGIPIPMLDFFTFLVRCRLLDVCL